MRIISGKHKGRNLTAPKNLPVRPTKDMAKEALFNILNNSYYFADLRVLDLFAGTGNISYEFASRGVEHILAVDIDMGCTNYIDKVSKQLELDIRTLKSDVFLFLSKNSEKFDIIFADPFYSMELTDFVKIPELVFSKEMLLEDGVLIIEHSKHTSLEHLPYFERARKYGGSVFSFFKS
ncbi:RsmD family RNA methyltransferase [Maribacter sp. R77961]|uniref:RsmD family RNA methyltransferase n=1 Tax=Maribacter sp. R77961 TaxID=3093871 RepID=UPI0037C86D82